MITEANVGEFLDDLDERCGFMSAYLAWQHERTEAPLAYSVGVGLAVLGASAPPWLAEPRTGTLATFWPVLVGPAGRARKTYAMGGAAKVLGEVDPLRILPEPSSAQGLVEELEGDGVTGLIPYGELADLLSGSSRPGAMHDLKIKLLRLWDGDDLSRRLAKNVVQIAHRPRVSLIGCAAPILLENATTHEDWTGGLMSRFVVFASDCERRYIIPPDAAPLFAPACDALRATILGGNKCKRPDGFTPDAYHLLASWAGELDERASAHPWASSIVARAQGVAIKVALLLHFDARSMSADWQIDEWAITAGIRVTEWHLASCIELLSTRVGTGWGRIRQSVLDALGDRECTLGMILRGTSPKQPKRVVTEALETLIAEGTVKQRAVPGGETRYSKRDAGDGT